MIPFEEWAAINQVEARRLARDPEIKPLWHRVEYAAIGWSNRIGHAEFAPGGLAVVLQTSNPKTGALSIPSMQQVANAIAEAKERGLVDESSTARCLVARADLVAKKGGKGGQTCKHHGINTRRAGRGR